AGDGGGGAARHRHRLAPARSAAGQGTQGPRLGAGAASMSETRGGQGPADRYGVGVDLGAGGVKVVLATTRGGIVGQEAEKTAAWLLPGGGAEQDPDDWWRAIVTATRRLSARGLVPAEEIAAICVSTQWGGLVPVDSKGQHLRNALIWMDSRGVEY